MTILIFKRTWFMFWYIT